MGAKARGLYWLAANGFPIPPTWVLSVSAFDLILSRTGLDRDVAEMRWNLAGLWNDWGAVQRVVAALEPQRVRVARVMRQVPLPDILGQELERVALMERLWAVRASPALSDGDGMFEGGQSLTHELLSLLSVPSGVDLWDAVRQVWASTFRREVLLRCAQQEVSLPGMAVVLHPTRPILPEDRSGEAFSVPPQPGLAGPVVQAVFGALQDVRGHIYGGACGRWVPLPRYSDPPRRALVSAGSEGGLALRPLPGEGLPLDGEEARRLADLVQAVARKWGGPVQISFFWPTGGELAVTQVVGMGR
jgi:cell wall assembly regulator SMI1